MNELKTLIAPKEWLSNYDRHISWYGGNIEITSVDQKMFLQQDKHKFSKQILGELKAHNRVLINVD